MNELTANSTTATMNPINYIEKNIRIYSSTHKWDEVYRLYFKDLHPIVKLNSMNVMDVTYVDIGGKSHPKQKVRFAFGDVAIGIPSNFYAKVSKQLMDKGFNENEGYLQANCKVIKQRIQDNPEQFRSLAIKTYLNKRVEIDIAYYVYKNGDVCTAEVVVFPENDTWVFGFSVLQRYTVIIDTRFDSEYFKVTKSGSE
uniref:AlNc14C213G8966 protein n=1 Tax=Albugo laibachii Nc14 TaxID=890382 RepID=F0WRG3_9STRA|nr:AlNc14C213G8966 [Albugo laibachii Nc14]|eukprot:CCA23926.1 AlNc14C213G8966 [Albugo laibachii Nc14]